MRNFVGLPAKPGTDSVPSCFSCGFEMLRTFASITGLTLVFCLAVPFSVVSAQDEAEHAEAETTAADDSHDDHGEEADSHGGESHSDDGHGGDGGHGDGHGADAGPPLNFVADLALWSLIVFVLLLVVLKKVAWGPIIDGLDKRESGIRAAIADAEENQRKSQALLAEYEGKLRDAEQTVAEMVAEAKRDAERTAQDIAAKAQADVDSMRERAAEEIGRAKDAALAEVFDSVNSRIALATEHVLGRAISGEDQERLVEEALAEIGS